MLLLNLRAKPSSRGGGPRFSTNRAEPAKRGIRGVDHGPLLLSAETFGEPSIIFHLPVANERRQRKECAASARFDISRQRAASARLNISRQSYCFFWTSKKIRTRLAPRSLLSGNSHSIDSKLTLSDKTLKTPPSKLSL